MADSDRVARLERRVKLLTILVVVLGAGGVGLGAAALMRQPFQMPQKLVFENGTQFTTIDSSGLTIRGPSGAFGAGPGSITVETRPAGSIQISHGSIGISDTNGSLTMQVKKDAPSVTGEASSGTHFRLEALPDNVTFGMRRGPSWIQLATDSISKIPFIIEQAGQPPITLQAGSRPTPTGVAPSPPPPTPPPSAAPPSVQTGR